MAIFRDLKKELIKYKKRIGLKFIFGWILLLFMFSKLGALTNALSLSKGYYLLFSMPLMVFWIWASQRYFLKK